MISVEQTQAIANDVQAAGLLDETLVFQLRQQYPDIHFTYCLEDDIVTGKPVLEQKKFNLYLVDGREHCLCLTNDYEHATGVVLAEIIPDDD